MGSNAREQHTHDEPLSDAEEASYQLTIDSFQENKAYSCVRRIPSYPTKPTITALQLSREPSFASRKRKTRSLRRMGSFSSLGTNASYKNSAGSMVSVSTVSSTTDQYEKSTPIHSLERLDCMGMSSALATVGSAVNSPLSAVKLGREENQSLSVTRNQELPPVAAQTAAPAALAVLAAPAAPHALSAPATPRGSMQQNHPTETFPVAQSYQNIKQYAAKTPQLPTTNLNYFPHGSSQLGEPSQDQAIEELTRRSLAEKNRRLTQQDMYRRTLVETRRSAVEHEMKRHSGAETRWSAIETYHTITEKNRVIAEQGRRRSMAESHKPFRPVPNRLAQHAVPEHRQTAPSKVQRYTMPEPGTMFEPPKRPHRGPNEQYIPQELLFSPIVSPYSQAVPPKNRARPSSLPPTKQAPSPDKRFSNPSANFKHTIRSIPESVLLAELGIRERPSLAYRISRHEAGIPITVPDVFDFELPGFDPQTGDVRNARSALVI